MLKSRTVAAYLLLLLFVSLGLSSAETADDMSLPNAGEQSEDSRTIDVSFEEYALPEVLSYLSEKGGVNIIIDSESDLANYRVSADLNNVTWLQVLNYLAEKYEFDIEKTAQGVYVLKQPHRIDLVANKASLREVIRQIAEEGGFNVVIDSDVDGEVHAYFKQVPWPHALELILKSTDYVSVKEKYNVIRITSTAKLKEQPEVRVFRLNYIEPAGSAYTPTIETDYAKEESSNDVEPDSMMDIIAELVGEDGMVKYEESNNAIIVKASTKIMEEVEQLISELDREPLQVSIDVRIYSVSLSKMREVGVKWSQGLIFSASGAKATNAVVFPFTNGFDSWEQYMHGASTRGPFFTSDPSVAGGDLDGSQLQMTIKLLEQYTNAEVVQQPRVTTLDNHTATIHIGDVVRFAEFEQTTSDSGVTGGYKEAENSPVELGVQLLVKPHVAIKDRNIMMTVIPKIEDTSSGQLFEEFGSGSTAIKLPQTKTEFVVSKMIIPDGNTGVLAGFVKTTSSKSGNKIPLLGEIPGLGWLFKNRVQEENKDVLLIFITPKIISSGTAVEVSDEFRKMRESLHEEFMRKQQDVVDEKVEEGGISTDSGEKSRPDVVPEKR